jgi:ATP-dependent protease HslVU (ClpYQ) peptidase subunit
MTVIVAARSEAGVTVAADSETTAGWERMRHANPKIWIAKSMIVGAAGCVRAAQVVRHHTDWPVFRPAEDVDIEAFLVKRVVPAIRDGAKAHGVAVEDEGVWSLSASFVLAWGDHLAVVHGNGAVTIPAAGRCAIGSGYAEALGVLGDEGPRWTTEVVCLAATRAAITAVGVGGPIHYATTRDLEIRR